MFGSYGPNSTDYVGHKFESLCISKDKVFFVYSITVRKIVLRKKIILFIAYNLWLETTNTHESSFDKDFFEQWCCKFLTLH
jgi:hypothetical protein